MSTIVSRDLPVRARTMKGKGSGGEGEGEEELKAGGEREDIYGTLKNGEGLREDYINWKSLWREREKEREIERERRG